MNPTQPTPITPKPDLFANKIGALWMRTSLSGNKYLSGEIELKVGDKIEKIYVTIMKSHSKFKVEGDKKPDYQVFLREPPKKQKDELLDEQDKDGL